MTWAGQKSIAPWWSLGLCLAAGLLGGGLPSDLHAGQYWCPDKGGGHIQFKDGPGCRPLVDPKKEAEREAERKAAGRPEPPVVKLENLASSTSAFMKQYRAFLECCAANVESAGEIDALIDEATSILKASEGMMAGRFNFAAQMPQSGGLTAPVVEARNKLAQLKATLGKLSEAEKKASTLDYEAAGRERRRIQEERDALGALRAPGEVKRAPTGADVGNSSFNSSRTVGSDLSKSSTFNQGAMESGGGSASLGSSFNKQAVTGPEAGTSSFNNPASTGSDYGASSPTNKQSAVGADAGNSSFNSMGNTGPSVGSSSFNK
jgi:hypothetical protein